VLVVSVSEELIAVVGAGAALISNVKKGLLVGVCTSQHFLFSAVVVEAKMHRGPHLLVEQLVPVDPCEELVSLYISDRDSVFGPLL